MSKPPDGATLSDDGYYWWDGTEWQQVDDGDAAASSSGTSTSSSAEDEEISIRVEGSLEEEPVELTLDELMAEGFTPDEAMA